MAKIVPQPRTREELEALVDEGRVQLTLQVLLLACFSATTLNVVKGLTVRQVALGPIKPKKSKEFED